MERVAPSVTTVAPSAPPPLILRRIGLIGDIHGEADALAAALDFLARQPDLTALLCTGDVAGVEPDGDSDACARLLTDAGVLTIRGNHDRWWLTEGADGLFKYTGGEMYKAFAQALPPYLNLQVPFGSALLCHGVGTNDMEGIYPGGEDDTLIYQLKGRRIYGWDRVMLCGHTHRRLVRTVGTVGTVGTLTDRLAIINAGTLRRDNEPCFSVIDFETGEAQFYDLDPMTHAITTAEKYRFQEP